MVISNKNLSHLVLETFYTGPTTGYPAVGVIVATKQVRILFERPNFLCKIYTAAKVYNIEHFRLPKTTS